MPSHVSDAGAPQATRERREAYCLAEVMLNRSRLRGRVCLANGVSACSVSRFQQPASGH